MSSSIAFLATIHPYDALSPEVRAEIAASMTRHDIAAGVTIYEIDDVLPGLYLIESGRITISDRNHDILSQLGPRNSFGERGLLREGLAVTTAQADEDSVVHLLPRDTLFQLIAAHGPVARFFDRGRPAPDRGSEIAAMKVGAFLRRTPVSCPSDTTIHGAARTMRDAGVSSIGITGAGDRLVGIVTARDMCNRVVAEMRDLSAPVAEVMTPDPVSLPASALGVDVLNIMQERRVGHLPIVEDGRFIGMISQTDLTRLQAISSAAMLREVSLANTVEELGEAAARIPELLVQLVDANHRHEVVTRMITDISDAITRRLIAMAEDRLGPAPNEWLWAACGSQGRQEQTGLSDQDNVIIMADGTDPAHPWFRDLARFVSDGLNAAGYVYCPGDMMATNDRWRRPLSVWRSYFTSWIETPSPEAQLLASVMFDLRPIHGRADLIEDLRRETLERAARNSIFVAHMVSNSLGHRPPLGLIGGLATIRSGEHRNTIDMKLSGVVPITELARVYALEGGIAAVNTRARLEDARHKGIISGTGGSDLIAAYDLIQTMRLRNQADQVKAGRRPDNYLPPANLPDFQRSHLRDAFVVVRGMQSAIGHGKGMLR